MRVSCQEAQLYKIKMEEGSKLNYHRVKLLKAKYKKTKGCNFKRTGTKLLII